MAKTVLALRGVLTVTEWAAKCRELPQTSTSAGPYNPDIVPYARRPQDLLTASALH